MTITRLRMVRAGVCMALLLAGMTGWAQPRTGRVPTNVRVYGKVLDAETHKPLEFAVVQVFQSAGDSSAGPLISGALSEGNGDFSVENIPRDTEARIVINLVGYSPLELTRTIRSSSVVPELDLGNILLSPATVLSEVVIEGEVPAFRMDFDKRVFEVDKNPVAEGGTAEDVIQNIPGLQVDIDGNITLRNAAPQIFVDGRPTTLSMDQIPADAIQRIEIITNPSSKYDASGGGGGILNVVMKRNRARGYNGSIRGGVDRRPRANAGLDLNVREGRFNFFAGVNYNGRKRISTGSTGRINLGDPQTRLLQSQENINEGYNLRVNLGADWFLDNRNTLTLNPNITRGAFQPFDMIYAETDTLLAEATPRISSVRQSDNLREYQNNGISLLLKHLFPSESDEFTADFSFNDISSVFEGNYFNQLEDRTPSELRQTGRVNQWLAVVQMDYTRTLHEDWRFETGIRGSVRDYESRYENFQKDQASGEFLRVTALNVNYHYLDQVYAAYSNLKADFANWKVQAGLRVESSDYRAELLDTTLAFRNTYPLSLFPSLFVTRVISETQDIQFSLNRKISRPSFFVLSPFTDYADSLNINRGNPSLRPEFTQIAELSYQNAWNRNNTFIATLYGRYSTDLTVSQLITEYSPVLDREVVITTYANASSSLASGLELILRNKPEDWLEITTSFNAYWSSIDGSNIQSGLTNSLSSWWVKTNASFRLKGNWLMQFTGDYSSRRSLEMNGTSRNTVGGMGDMGGGPWGQSTNTVQGYVRPVYGIDLSVRKDFLKDRTLSVTFSIRDALRTRVQDVHTESPFFTQDTFRRRDPQFWRINVSYRFGKADASVFRRKSQRSGGESMEG